MPESPRARRPPIAGIRRLLLVLLLAGLAGLAVLLARGCMEERAAQPADGSGEGAPRGDITLVGEGFEFTQTDRDRPVFRIRGDSVRVRRGQIVLLDEVDLTLFDDDGVAYDVSAREASYDQTTREATLDGDLRLTGPQGMEITAEGLALLNEGRLAESTSAVELRYADDYTGSADRLIARIPRDLYVLAGNVVLRRAVDRGPPVVLTATSVLFQRNRHQLRADRSVELVRGRDRLYAQRINAILSDDDRRLTFLRARWNVAGAFRPAAASDDDDGGERQPAVLRVRGHSLSLLMDDVGVSPRSVELEGTPTEPARLSSESAEGLVDTLIANYVVGTFEAGRTSVEAFGSPRLTEAPADEPDELLREVHSERLTAGFAAGGRLEKLSAWDGVEYCDPQLVASGDRLLYTAADADGPTLGEAAAAADEGGGRAEFFGQPVRVVSDRGELLAPHIVYTEESGLLQADGGARAVLAEGTTSGLGGSPLGDGGPLRVEAETAFYRRQPASALFRGQARAWQGDNLLLADDIRLDRGADGDVVTAGGSVKSVWVPESGPPAEAAPAGEAGGAAPPPVEVFAESMEYRRGDGVLVYGGGVRSEQQGRTLACRELTVTLGEDGGAESMVCAGAVRLEDRTQGNVASGDRALYDLTARTIEITGEPVTLTQGDGGQVKGRRVIYDIDAGRARVAGGEPAAPAGQPEPPPEPAPAGGAPPETPAAAAGETPGGGSG